MPGSGRGAAELRRQGVLLESPVVRYGGVGVWSDRGGQGEPQVGAVSEGLRGALAPQPRGEAWRPEEQAARRRRSGEAAAGSGRGLDGAPGRRGWSWRAGGVTARPSLEAGSSRASTGGTWELPDAAAEDPPCQPPAFHADPWHGCARRSRVPPLAMQPEGPPARALGLHPGQ